MKPISFDENRKIQVEILLEFVKFCDENNLEYFLAYGTLIGAVRHNGFIPWDDDIDVHMPRPDYDKFIQLYREKMLDSRYKISIPTDKTAKHPFVKFYDSKTAKIEKGIAYNEDYLGIDIDVWPLDGQPEDEIIFKKWFRKLKFNYFLFFGTVSSLTYGNLKRRLKVLATKILAVSKNRVIAKTDKMHSLYPYDSVNVVGTMISCFNYETERFPKEWFRDYVLMDFEGHKLKAPIDYDKVLRKIYEDYMQLPPEEQRVTHHSNNVFWKE